MSFTPQNFVDQNGPVIASAWLNPLDVFANSVFAGAQTVPAALAALGFVKGTFTMTATGCSGSPTSICQYVVLPGWFAILHIAFLSGTSTANTFTGTGLPAILQPATITFQEIAINASDNSVEVGVCSVAISNGSGTAQFLKNGSLTGWTASGTKSVAPAFSYLLS